MTIKRRDFDLLDGLHASGHSYIAASEAADALRLAEDGLVKIWQTGTGFSAWQLTEYGKMRVEHAKAMHEAIV